MRATAGKRILMLLENHPYPQDGRVRREAMALREAGYQVSVICPAAGGQPLRETVAGVCVCRYPAPPPGDGLLGYLWEYGYSMLVASILTFLVFIKHGFDVIHAHNPPDTFALIAAPYKLLGKRFIFDHHDLSPEMYDARFRGEGNSLVRRTLLLLEQLTFHLADYVLATNQSYKEIAIGRGGVAEHRVAIVRNGPELNRVQQVPADRTLREKAKTVIGYVGVMGAQDGVDYLIRALSHLVHDLGRRDFYCVIIGKGDALPSLKALAQELELDPYVCFTGRVSDEDLMRYLSTADICVDPDPSNPFNDRSSMIKMTEYMALGKPIVAFALPEHVVTAQSAALYAQPNEERELAAKLAELMDAPGRRAEMGRIGRERIEKELAWHHQASKLLGVYEQIFARHQLRSSASRSR